LHDDDRKTLDAARREATERFKCDKGESLLVASEAYVDRFGSIPSWSWKWLERLSYKLRDKDMRNYLKAVVDRDYKKDKVK
jgi:hypothetical protein